MKLYLDPGHGGSDSGAVGNGLLEKNLNLAIALKIREKLSGYDIDIRMSRTNDKYLTLQQRTDDANKWGADYFLSIHINAGGGVGYEDFIHDKLSDSSLTAKIRNTIHAEIIKQVDFKNRGKKKANFHVIRESNMPAMLSENGFIDNKEDAAKLKSDAYLDKIAQGHANGIIQAFNLQKGVPIASDSVLIQTGGLGVDNARKVMEYCMERKWSFSVDYDGDGNPKATVGRLNTRWQREFETWLNEQGWFYKIIN